MLEPILHVAEGRVHLWISRQFTQLWQYFSTPSPTEFLFLFLLHECQAGITIYAHWDAQQQLALGHGAGLQTALTNHASGGATTKSSTFLIPKETVSQL